MKLFIKILFFPFTLIYGTAVFIRNKFFDSQIIKSVKFEHPVIINVGNLAVGGTGKTPHVEHLVNALKNEFITGILSRGYKRKTSGFLLAKDLHNSEDLGDEPKQYKTKFNDVMVAVDEDRVHGIQMMKELNPQLEVVVLDDAFQHRRIKPHLNVLITEFNSPYTSDFLMPSGRLREWACGSKRADYIVVSKCPIDLSEKHRSEFINKLAPLPTQKVFFSHLIYGDLVSFNSSADSILAKIDKTFEVILVTGIGNPTPLVDQLSSSFGNLHHLKFGDHHHYTQADIVKIRNRFNELEIANKIIISTEKDIMRLSLPTLKEELNELPVFYLPIKVGFTREDKTTLGEEISNYVRANK